MTDNENGTLTCSKANLGHVVRPAETLPQTIDKNGGICTFVIAAKARKNRSERRETLAEFLMAPPLRGVELDVERLADAPRDWLF